MKFWVRPCAELSQCSWRSALACTSVFRGKLARWLRIGAFLEGPLTTLRALQSGHPGDYVLWLTVGLAVFGSATLFLLR